jgi:phage terminase small subunit
MKPEYEIFVAKYLENENGTQAAIAAGWSPKSAAKQATRLLKRMDIQGAIAQARASKSKKRESQAAQTEITVERVMNELGKIAFGNLQQCFDPETGEMLPIHKMDPEVAATLTAYEKDKDFQKIKTAAKLPALETIAKILGMVRQEQQQGNNVTIVLAEPPQIERPANDKVLLPEWD